ncbi:hypothetical protein BJ165DRAFT_1518134 [Panaeolus papilionaceus]|nr:hypothetical protein BJ165DRAFT_1518134 [Panaeolus papilionaceus]
MSTCKEWHLICIQNVNLWNTFASSDLALDMEKIRLHTARSKQSPLHVRLDLHGAFLASDEMKMCQYFLSNNRTRIETLDLVLPYTSNLEHVLVGSFPALKTLSFQAPKDALSPTILTNGLLLQSAQEYMQTLKNFDWSRFPLIDSLSFSNPIFCRSLINKPTPHAITRLHVHFVPIDDLVHILSYSPNLHSLSINELVIGDLTNTQTIHRYEMSHDGYIIQKDTGQSHKRISLPFLRHLRLPNDNLLSILQDCPIVSLYISSPSHFLVGFIHRIPTGTLSMTIDSPALLSDSWMEVASLMPMTKLTIRLSSSDATHYGLQWTPSLSLVTLFSRLQHLSILVLPLKTCRIAIVWDSDRFWFSVAQLLCKMQTKLTCCHIFGDIELPFDSDNLISMSASGNEWIQAGRNQIYGPIFLNAKRIHEHPGNGRIYSSTEQCSTCLH